MQVEHTLDALPFKAKVVARHGDHCRDGASGVAAFLLERGEDGVFECAVGGAAVCAGDGGFAGPGAEVAACFADDGGDAGDVPDADARVEDDFCAAGGDEHVAEDIAPAAVELDLSGEGHVCVGAVDVSRDGTGEERGVFELGDVGDFAGAAVPGCAVALGRAEEITDGGEADGADEGLVIDEAADDGAVERDAVDEGLGAVDGVDDPGVCGIAGGAAVLFAEDGVGREVSCDAIADDGFGLAVGLCDGGFVGFFLDACGTLAGVEVGERALAAGVCGFEGDVEEVFEGGGRGHGARVEAERGQKAEGRVSSRRTMQQGSQRCLEQLANHRNC